MLHFGRFQESVHTHLYLKLSISMSEVKTRKNYSSFFNIIGMQGSFVDFFLKADGIMLIFWSVRIKCCL
jgi:hypothetical protein